MSWDDESEDEDYYSGYKGKTYVDHKRKMVQITQTHIVYALVAFVIVGIIYFISSNISPVSKVILLYLLSINITTFLAYSFDKSIAVLNTRIMRVPEAVLHLLELFGGSPSGILARNALNHKKRKVPFWTVSWMIIIVQIFIIWLPWILKLPMTLQLIIIIAFIIFLFPFYFFNPILKLYEKSPSSLIALGWLIIIVGNIGFQVFIKSSNQKSDYASIESDHSSTLNKTTLNKEVDELFSKTASNSKSKCHYFYINATSLNVRTDPSMNAAIVKKLYKNNKICVTEKKKSWSYIENTGWIYNKYISNEAAVASSINKKIKLAKRDASIWHCSAKSERASGWVEKVGKQNAIDGALHQCEIRRVSDVKCSLDNCYKIR